MLKLSKQQREKINKAEAELLAKLSIIKTEKIELASKKHKISEEKRKRKILDFISRQ
ncbi:hypothetical protein KKA13_00070 [Patescibacteria group bacterium]|nr:hypothetical protein [Patescibacteria group bacterium]MBU1613127.1 hypothetical protein [Patescibacteria group bacterium]